MCIAILNKKGLLTKETITTCEKRNPDGMGLMYAVNGKITIHKQMKDVKSFYKIYKEVRERYPDNQIVLHFRISTSGKVNMLNCHPFEVNRQLAFVHNGVMNIDTSAHPHLNDTQVFNNLVLKALSKDFIYKQAYRYLIEQTIGGGNKLIFLDAKGNSHIINEKAGHWDDSKENWFSNDTYKEYNYRSMYDLDMFGFSKPYRAKKSTEQKSDWVFNKKTKTWDMPTKTENKVVDDKQDETGNCFNCFSNLYHKHEIQEQMCWSCINQMYGITPLDSER